LSKYIYKTNRTHCSISNQKHFENLSENSYKIAILLIYQDDYNKQWNNQLMRRIINNRNVYAKLHNYDVINANHLIDNSRPIAWSKLLAVKYYLREYDYIFYTDMDAIIMNLFQPLSLFIEHENRHDVDVFKNKEQTGDELIADVSQKDIIMTNDWNGPNTGMQ